MVGDAYASIVCGIIVIFALRNAIVQTQRFLLRRRQRAQLAALSPSEKSSAGAASIYSGKPTVLRISDKIDAVLNKPVGVWPFNSADMTWFRFLMVSGIIIVSSRTHR